MARRRVRARKVLKRSVSSEMVRAPQRSAPDRRHGSYVSVNILPTSVPQI